MPAQQQLLTFAQQRKLRPKRLMATGTFDARIDLTAVIFQTTTLKHNFERKVYNVEGRHADNSVSLKELHIQIPENVAVGQVIKLEEQEFTDLKVWYSVTSLPSTHYTVRCIEGTLTIERMPPGVLEISGTLHGVTDKSPEGIAHIVDVEFDLTS